MEIFNADCLEKMKDLIDDSIDLIFCDLPYGQTSCKWDCKIDLEQFWKQLMRIKKTNTPIFFTTTTKFGVELINSAPKKCPFRYDVVWIKSAPAGFLSAKKMPMRKHEMLYVFYEKLPFYDLSSHTHKFLKEGKKTEGDKGNECYGKFKYYNNGEKGYEPPLPVSVVKEEPAYYMKDGKTIYNGGKAMGVFNKGGTAYDPPLPVSVVKEDGAVKDDTDTLYGNVDTPDYIKNNITRNELRRKYKKEGKSESAYDPPLPVSVVKEDNCKYDVNKNTYGGGKEGRIKISKDKKDHQQKYDPPLPVSVVKEDTKNGIINEGIIYNGGKGGLYRNKAGQYDPPLPVSVVKEDVYTNGNRKGGFGGEQKGLGTCYQDPALISSQDVHKKNGLKSIGYDPPLPTSALEIKSTRGKHSTEKPVALMEWILKYYSKEGDVVLDATMGSGSMGVACKNMKRAFIGIEKDKEIFKVAEDRLK